MGWTVGSQGHSNILCEMMIYHNELRDEERERARVTSNLLYSLFSSANCFNFVFDLSMTRITVSPVIVIYRAEEGPQSCDDSNQTVDMQWLLNPEYSTQATHEKTGSIRRSNERIHGYPHSIIFSSKSPSETKAVSKTSLSRTYTT